MQREIYMCRKGLLGEAAGRTRGPRMGGSSGVSIIVHDLLPIKYL